MQHRGVFPIPGNLYWIDRSMLAGIQTSAVLVALLLLTGCATTRTSDTPRTAIEQLLISNAVDHALAKVDFGPLQGRSVYVNDKYLDGLDKNYVAASVRHRILMSGARLMDKEADAEVIMEVRSGGLGTDRAESFIGIPQVAAPGPFPLQIPEIQLMTNKTQTATAKIGIVAYDAKTKQSIGDGGVALSRAEDNNLFIFGVGPFNSGQVKEEVSTATGRGGIAFELARYLPVGTKDEDEVVTAPVNFAPLPEPPLYSQPGPEFPVPPVEARNPYAPGSTNWPR